MTKMELILGVNHCFILQTYLRKTLTIDYLLYEENKTLKKVLNVVIVPALRIIKKLFV